MIKTKRSVHTLLRFLLTAVLCCLQSVASAVQSATIDILTVFDESALSSLRQPTSFPGGQRLQIGSSEAMAHFAIAQLNQVMNNSGLGHKVHFRNCGVMHLNYRAAAARKPGNNGSELATDLQALCTGTDENGQKLLGTLSGNTTSTPATPEPITIQQAMEATGADLCIMFVAYDIDSSRGCVQGLAQLSNYFILTADDATPSQYAVFNVMTVRQHARVLSHELCHLLGAGHTDTQYRQPGPQSETDAAGLGTRVGEQYYTTLMGTVADYDTTISKLSKAGFRAIWLNMLSHPTTVMENGQSIKLGDPYKHNNAAVVLRHATPVSMYHCKGDEQVVNDNFEDAIPVPPLIPWTEKKQRLLYACAFNKLEEYAQHQAAAQLSTTSATPRELRNLYLKNLREYWNDRKATAAQIISHYGLETAYISPALVDKQTEKNTFIACLTGTNTHATAQPGEQLAEEGCHRTVWFSITPPVAGKLEVLVRKTGTTEDFVPVLSLFRGTELSSLQLLSKAGEDESSPHYVGTPVSAEVRENETIYLSVDSTKAVKGQFNLLIKLTSTSAGPTPQPNSTDKTPTPDNEKTPTTDSGAWIVNNTTQSHNESDWTTEDSVLLSTAIGFILATMAATAKLMAVGFSSTPGLKPGALKANAPKRVLRQHKYVLIGTVAGKKKRKFNINLNGLNKQNSFRIGREAPADLTIKDKAISSIHASLRLHPDATVFTLILVDEGSTNGTTVDGRELGPGDSATIREGSTIIMGKSSFTFHKAKPKHIFIMPKSRKVTLWLVTLILSLSVSVFALVQLCNRHATHQVTDFASAPPSPEHHATHGSEKLSDSSPASYKLVRAERLPQEKSRQFNLNIKELLNELHYSEPKNDGIVAEYEVELPPDALDWSRPANEPAEGDTVTAEVLPGIRYSFIVRSVEISTTPRKVIVTGQLSGTMGDATMIALDGRLLLQIDDRTPERPRVYTLFFAIDNTGKNSYIVQEIDSTRTSEQSQQPLDIHHSGN